MEINTTRITAVDRQNENLKLPGTLRSARPLRNSWQLLALPLLFFIAIPIVAIFLKVPYADFFQNLDQTQVLQAIRLSATTSVLSTFLILLLGTPVALLLTQRNHCLFRFIDTLIDLPTVLPPSVAGIALLMAFGRRGLLGAAFTALNVSIPFTTLAVVMAQTFIAAPLYIKAAAIGFSSIGIEMKEAAALDGATRWQTFRFILLPMAWTSLMSGSVMAWARALGEFGATIIFAGNFPGRTQTMPLAIYIGFEIDLNVALSLSVILVCFSFLTILLVKSLLHKRLDESFTPALDRTY